MPQDNVYFKCTSTLPDLKGPLSKEVPTIFIIDAIAVLLHTWYKVQKSKSLHKYSGRDFHSIANIWISQQ